MRRTGDAIEDFLMLDRDRALRDGRLPVCAECGQPIYQEFAVMIDGRFYCDECISMLRRAVE